MNNFHVIAVHFPVAFLTIYAIAELVRFRVITSQPFWFYIKGFLVVVGELGACAAALTGLLIKSSFSYARNVIAVHETFAILTICIFGVLALAYLISAIEKMRPERARGYFFTLAGKFLRSPLPIILAFLGLVAVTVTGALGGSIAFGPTAEPASQFIYGLFFR